MRVLAGGWGALLMVCHLGGAVTEQEFVAEVNIGTARNNFSGWVGARITIGPLPLQVSALGRWHLAGNSADHAVKLIQVADGTDVPGGQAIVRFQPGTAVGFVYAALEPPVLLPADSSYYLLSQEVVNGDTWYHLNTFLTHTPVAEVDLAAFVGGASPVVEAGLHDQSYGPVSFKYLRGFLPPVVRWIAPSDPSAFLAPATVDLEARAELTDGEVSLVEFFAGNTKLGDASSAPYRWQWNNAPVGAHELRAVATDEFGRRGTSSVLRVSVVVPTPLVSLGSSWKYWDNGSLPDPFWTSAEFDASAWNTGNAPLGYGSEQTTTISYGPDPYAKHLTTYFRHSFPVDTLEAFSQLRACLWVDDGAVVYLNGVELWRDNMPPGEVGSQTAAVMDGDPHASSVQVPAGLLREGLNVLAVEVHQAAWESEDLLFDLELGGSCSTTRLVRGPYLQRGTPTEVVVRWRTDIPASSRVQFGTELGVWDGNVDDNELTTEHEVLLRGLLPDTQYYYSIGSMALPLVEGPDYFFLTAPVGGKPTRIWVLGDSGTANDSVRAVRDAYYAYTGTRHTDLWLMLGDNAYGSGTDPQYQAAVYDIFPRMLRKSVLWPTLGNHDTDHSTNPGPDLPYFRMFTLPAQGEAGGIPSGTEKYYSFNYGDIHFVCLDSMSSERASDGAMCTWLRTDLEQNTNQWIIAFWHHPPYSKGSHNSDTEGELIQMRENVLPILEQHGVDLVLSGHSHNYERSFLLHGHYSNSGTLTPEMIVDNGDGRPGSGWSYRKFPDGAQPNRGAVYAVAGSSGQATFFTGRHPAMFISLLELGSMILDVDGARLEATFLQASGQIGDWFVISKDARMNGPFSITDMSIENGAASLTWNSIEREYYSVQIATNDLLNSWFFISGAERALGPSASRTFPLPPGVDRAAFRILNSSED